MSIFHQVLDIQEDYVFLWMLMFRYQYAHVSGSMVPFHGQEHRIDLKQGFKFYFDGCIAPNIDMFSDIPQVTVAYRYHTCICHSSKQPVIVECWLNITHSSQFFPHRAIFQLVCVRNRINY